MVWIGRQGSKNYRANGLVEAPAPKWISISAASSDYPAWQADRSKSGFPVRGGL